MHKKKFNVDSSDSSYNKVRYESTRNHILEKKAEARKVLKAVIFIVLGDKCVKCGFSDKRALQVDHKDGSGADARESGRTGIRLLEDVLSNPEEYQILCANCNWIKRVENGEGGWRE